ncbi:hypothetical protein GF386_02130 [Candidatus Pacearchaeota archaeon]|nr:hypothetical protein [Candidatus Pacearchaeota archaeon]MBD3282966.1 hypothetical protein [Candidatus Pacearchaeota archaeon]
MTEISKLMLCEHERIDKLLKEFEKAVSDKKDVEEKFSKFKWTLEKHMFLEEKAIFNAFVKRDDVDDIFELMNEHGDIMRIVNQMEEEITDSDMEELKTILMEHVDFENNNFYPKLDELLSDNQKKEISEKCREIIKS